MTSTRVSDAELAALIASFTTAPPPTGNALTEPVAAAAADSRCPVTELRTQECGHCRPAPAAPVRVLGPWITAAYKGACAGCGTEFDLFDQIRADGNGDWIAQCCGNVDASSPAADQLQGLIAPAVITQPVAALSAPARPAGPPTSTIRELRQVLLDFEAARPRTMQVALGPSELGTPCQQQIARKLVGAPRQPVADPTWAPFQGTAVHRSMEDVVAFWNAQLGRERWLAEDRLTVDPGLPDAVDPIEGNGDAFDTDWDMVVDWKHTGKTALDKLRRGIKMGRTPAEQVSPEYRVQGHLYGFGHARKGRPVRWVRLVLLARSHDFDESQEWTEAYDESIALAAIDRYYATHDLLTALGGPQLGDLIAIVPTAPNRDTCKWCPFMRPGFPSTWQGCPGDKALDTIVERATDGLIDPATK